MRGDEPRLHLPPPTRGGVGNTVSHEVVTDKPVQFSFDDDLKGSDHRVIDSDDFAAALQVKRGF
jgi:hypothetical protein